MRKRCSKAISGPARDSCEGCHWPQVEHHEVHAAGVQVQAGLAVDVAFSAAMGTGVTTPGNYTPVSDLCLIGLQSGVCVP